MKYVIGIGTNLGNKMLNIDVALNMLSKRLRIIRISSVYESRALLKTDMPKQWDMDFLNLAILIDFEESPLNLLATLKSVEKEMGREQNMPLWAPRIIDLDILIAENLLVKEENLQIPHKELLNRGFALIPASEIAPNFIHPFAQKKLCEYNKA